MANDGRVVIRIDGDASGFESALGGVRSSASKALSGIASVAGKAAKGIGIVYGAISAAWSAVGLVSVKYNAQIEQMQTSFEVMTGSAEEAANVVERLRTMGANTPFETADLASATQLLMQYGFTADEAIDKMSMLGDIAQGNTDAMMSIATGYAQMASAGKVNLQDIKQMINGGFNPLQEISERTGESMESLYARVSNGTMSIDEITESMRYATSEGGKFYQSMEKQSQTLNGQISTLKDNLSTLGGLIFEPLSNTIRDKLLPDANAIIGQLTEAYQKAGMDGLINEVTRIIPKLTEAAVSGLSKMFAGISKRLPAMLKSLLSGLPSIVKGVGTLVPMLADTLFDIAASAVESLIGMLPTLVPMLLEAIGNLAASIFTGLGKIVSGIVSGVEQMFHQGQTKIAGVWVSNEAVAKYTFDADIDVSPAVSAIETAYDELRTALMTPLLSDEQRAEVEGMIDQGYDAIKAKLMSFGLSEEEAAPLAAQISAASDVITEELRKLDVGVDTGTILKWFVQANGSNVALMHYARMAGLSDAQVNEIIGVYNTANGRLRDGTPNFAQTIYETLTDGMVDDEETVEKIKGDVYAWADEALTAAEDAYNKAGAELDPEAPDYQTRLNELNAEYDATVAEIESIRDDSITIIDNLAGQSTQSVENAYQTIADIDTRVGALEERIHGVSEEARSMAEAAFNVVRSGANADEATIGMAIQFKVEQFHLEQQSAEDAYNAAVEELNMKLNNGEITREEYNTSIKDAQATRDAAMQAAREAFDKAFAEIIMGVAESEGNQAAMEAAMKAMGTKVTMQDLYDNMFDIETGEFNMAGAEKAAAALAEQYGEDYANTFLENVNAFNAGDMSADEFVTYMENVLTDIDADVADAMKEGMGEKTAAAWAAAYQEGMLTGTDFDVSKAAEQIAAMWAAVDLTKTAEPLGEDVVAGMGKGIENADLTKSGQLLAQNTERSARAGLDSNSPSKKMIPVGKDVAAGIGQGMGEYDFSTDAETMARGAQSATRSALTRNSRTIGRMFSEGIASGIRSGRSGVVNAAIEVARAAVTAIKTELQIHSPSRVTEGLGEMTGKGFEIGMVESLNSAVRAAQSVVGSMNLTPRLTAPELGSAFASAAGSIADAESARPIYLNVNGRTLASVTAGDTRRAQNSYNRSIALGVGK